MRGARRPPPPPPSGSDNPPPLPSRGGAGDSGPPPLPSRPGESKNAMAEAADEMYEDMSGSASGFPCIIDARPNKRNLPTSALLTPDHSSSSNSRGRSNSNESSKPKPKSPIRMWDSFRMMGSKHAGGSKTDAVNSQNEGEKQRRATVGEIGRPVELQQENLEMDDEYELPLPNAQAGFQAFPRNQQPLPRNQNDDIDGDSGDDWSSEFDDVEDEPQLQADDTYELPNGLDQNQMAAQGVQEDVYQEPDGAFEQPTPKKVFGAGPNPLAVHPATLQISKLNLKVNAASQEPSKGRSQALLPPKVETTKTAPNPPLKLRPGGLIQTLADSLNAMMKDKKSAVESNDVKENISEDSSSASSISSQSAEQKSTPVISGKKILPPIPISPASTSKNETPSKKISRPEPPKKPDRLKQEIITQESINDETQLIYDQAETETLYSYNWFHGDITRGEGETRLKRIAEDGAFLIREKKDSVSDHAYTLVIMKKGKIHNLIIRRRKDQKLAIGDKEKPDEVCFSGLQELVEHHRKNNVRILKEDELVKLKSSPNRQ